MNKSKRVIAFAATILMVFSLLTCFAIAAPATDSYLPKGYVVVKSDWAGSNYLDKIPFELGGDTYTLEYGVTAIDTIANAQAMTLPAGVELTIILAPGVYGGFTFTKDVRLFGPYFGKSPNNKPGTDYYDPSLPDWAVANGRSLDETKEAVINGTVSLGNGCNKAVFDGLAFTGSGVISDAAHTDEKVRVDYTYRNLYYYGSGGAMITNNSSRASINRYIEIDQCRFEHHTGADSQAIGYRAVKFTMKNSWYGDMAGQHQLYGYSITNGNVLSHEDTISNYFIGNHFENHPGIGLINFALRSSVLGGADDLSRTLLWIEDNDFINCTSATGTTYVIRPQHSSNNQQLTIINNRFILEKGFSTGANSTAIYPYNDVAAAAHYSKLDISKNYFRGFDRPIYMGTSQVCQLLNIGPNYWDNGSGAEHAWDVTTANLSYKTARVFDSSCKYASTDFDILNSNIGSVSISDSNNDTRTATLYYVKSGVPTFRFNGDEVTYKVYSDAAYSNELTGDFTPSNGARIYVEATEGSYTCRYTVTLSSSKSALNNIYKYGDADIAGDYAANRTLHFNDLDNHSGYFTFPTGDDIEVSTGATVAVYPNASRSGDPIPGMTLEDGVNKAYLRVTAPSGATADWTVFVYGNAGSEAGGAKGGSSECDLFKLIVPKGTVSGSASKGFTVEMGKNVKSINPQLIVSSKATYQFYLDAAGKYPAADNDVIKLNASSNVFYVRVIAEDGTISKAIKITVNSDRSAVTYSDASSIPGYAKTAVNNLNKKGYGIFTGDEHNKFNPRAEISRYELAKVVVMLGGVNVDMAASIKLGDVFDDFSAIQHEAPWAIPYIRAAYASGLLAGSSDSKGNLYFNGSASTSREEFVTVMVRMAATEQGVSVSKLYSKNEKAVEKAYSGANYADKKSISSWALKYVKLGTYFGYVEGDGRFFRPKNNIIRADVAVVIYNYVK